MELIDRIKKIILDNNYFDTLPGQRFLEWNEIRDVQAVISFGGRSKLRESYRLSPPSDSEALFVTHLYIDRWGDVRVQTSNEDSDDMNFLLKPSGDRIEAYDDDTVREWIDLLTI